MDAPDAVTRPINLGNPVETSAAELAQLVIDLTGSRSQITHKPLPVDDPIQRCPDIVAAIALLLRVQHTAGKFRTCYIFESSIWGVIGCRMSFS